jgi:hypothetical protein
LYEALTERKRFCFFAALMRKIIAETMPQRLELAEERNYPARSRVQVSEVL